jgi:hypothetical protein
MLVLLQARKYRKLVSEENPASRILPESVRSNEFLNGESNNQRPGESAWNYQERIS